MLGRRASEPSGSFRVPKTVHVDLSTFPIVRTTLPETVTPELIDEMFAALRAAEERRQPYVPVYDVTAVRSFAASAVVSAIRAHNEGTTASLTSS